ncbi:MAG: type III pantothenate kinase [Planctomycetes bacterium]|nr:type III pantothenate kinase [Planctomycetota bacterium]
MNEILAADIGNSNITLCRMHGMKGVWYVDASSKLSAAELGKRLKLDTSLPLVIASVNPPATKALEAAWKKAGGNRALVLGRDYIIPIANKTDSPKQAGQDRLCNALAATHYSKGNAIVVDFGTAITFDVLKNGAYVGGVITPGIGLAMEALHQKTALLPLVTPEGKPPVLGTNTVAAINAGVFYGYIGLVTNIVAELKKTFKKAPRVLATGGYGAYLQPHIKAIERVVPMLTHEGIAMSYAAFTSRER